jgi:hypothetical protein
MDFWQLFPRIFGETLLIVTNILQNLNHIKLHGKIAFVTGLMQAWPVLASLPLRAVDPINIIGSTTTGHRAKCKHRNG